MAGYTKNADGGYSVNYDDQRFQDVKTEQTQKETELNNTYDNILSNSDKYYQDQIDATKDYADKQSELQQAQTDFAIEQIEQQKDQTQKDYTKEQKASYADYMKQTKSNAQNMANSGLSNTGYSESSIVSMYNQYQNRVGSAKESLNQAILNYNNSIQQAILANNEKLAEIAYNALQTQNQLNQQSFEYKNSIILQKEQALQNLNDTYYARYQDVLAQINNEIDLQMALDQIDREYEQWMKEYTESIRQSNLEHERWMTEFNANQEQWKKEYALQEKEINANIAYTNAKIKETNASAAYTKAQTTISESSKSPYDEEKKEVELNSYGKHLYNGISKMNLKTNLNKEIARSLISGEYRNGNIDDDQAEKLFDMFDL